MCDIKTFKTLFKMIGNIETFKTLLKLTSWTNWPIP